MSQRKQEARVSSLNINTLVASEDPCLSTHPNRSYIIYKLALSIFFLFSILYLYSLQQYAPICYNFQSAYLTRHARHHELENLSPRENSHSQRNRKPPLPQNTLTLTLKLYRNTEPPLRIPITDDPTLNQRNLPT